MVFFRFLCTSFRTVAARIVQHVLSELGHNEWLVSSTITVMCTMWHSPYSP